MSVKRWLETLRAPPDAVSSARESLLARAHDIAERTQLAPSVPTEIDVIVAGSGCLSLYYLGVHSVFDRLRTLGRLKVARYSGASSGAQAPYELVLTGVPSTFTTYLAAGC